MASQRVIVVDDHPLFREAVRQALTAAFPGIAIAEAGTLDAVSDILAQDSDYDLVLLDLKMPGVQGFSGLVYLRAEHPSVPIAVVSASEEAHLMRRAIELGASGYIPKSSSAETMKLVIAAVLNGDIWLPEDAAARSGSDNEADQLARRLTTLTPQQIRVLMMLREGLLNKQIAYQLKVSEATVKAHVSAILQKLNVSSRTQAVIAATRIDGIGGES